MVSQRGIDYLREASIFVIGLAFYIQAYSMWKNGDKRVNPWAFIAYAVGSLALIIELYNIKDPVYWLEVFGFIGTIAVIYLYYR